MQFQYNSTEYFFFFFFLVGKQAKRLVSRTSFWRSCKKNNPLLPTLPKLCRLLFIYFFPFFFFFSPLPNNIQLPSPLPTHSKLRESSSSFNQLDGSKYNFCHLYPKGFFSSSFLPVLLFPGSFFSPFPPFIFFSGKWRFQKWT